MRFQPNASASRRRVNPHYIESAEQLESFCRHLTDSQLIAFDTEFVAEDTYKPELCLIQVATADELAIIDPYECGSLDAFWQQIIDPNKRIVVHAGREECLFCFRATGKSIPGLFDVQLAAGFLGYEFPISYANLVNRMLGGSLDKEETRSDWRRRPLTNQQLKYAIQDVRDLPEIYEQLFSRLSDERRIDWLEEETSKRQSALAMFETDEQWHRMSGIQSLNGHSLAVAIALWRWRESESQRRNQPPRRLLRDDLIVELAKRKSSDPRRIASLRGMEHRYLKGQLEAIAEVIESAKNDEQPEWPFRQKPNRIQPSSMLIQYLASALSCICRRKNIAPSIVGTSDDLKEFVNYRLSSNRNQNSTTPVLLEGWRAKIVGRVLDDLLSGKASLQIQNPASDMPLKILENK